MSQHAPIMIEEALRLSVETTGQQASAANEKENHPQDDAWALALRALPVELFGRVGTWAIESLLAAKAATPSEERRRRRRFSACATTPEVCDGHVLGSDRAVS